MPNTYILFSFDSLHWTQGTRTNPTYFHNTDFINLRSSARANQFILSVKQNIVFDSTVYGHYGICKKTYLDSIQFHQLLRPIKYGTVSQFINFNERFIVPKVLDVTQSITLVQDFTQPGRLINGTITLVQTIHVNAIRNITITDELIFNSIPTILKLNYNYIQTKEITITPNTLISFVSTNLTPAITLTIKAPDFEDTDELHFNKVQHNTRNNDLIIYKDNMWPEYEIFNLHFSYLSQKNIYDLLKFVENTIGQDIIYNDFEGRQWLGLITNPTGEIVQPGRFNQQAHIIFEGSLVNNDVVSEHLTLSQNVSEVKI